VTASGLETPSAVDDGICETLGSSFRRPLLGVGPESGRQALMFDARSLLDRKLEDRDVSGQGRRLDETRPPRVAQRLLERVPVRLGDLAERPRQESALCQLYIVSTVNTRKLAVSVSSLSVFFRLLDPMRYVK